MSDTAMARRFPTIDLRNLAGVAELLTLLLPVAFFYSRGLAEALIAGIGILFLTKSWRDADWAWLRAPWMKASLAWWLWLVFCSAIGVKGVPALLQALGAIRLMLLAAALGNWVLLAPAPRRRLFLVLSACAAWLVEQCWQQYLFGRNFLGQPPFPVSGALTGPFSGLPRAGSAYVLFIFPLLLPWAQRIAAYRPKLGPVLAGAFLAFGVITMVLIGQRMPIVLMMFGVVLLAWLLPETRRLALLALALAALAVPATKVISPTVFAHIVLQFWDQLSHFTSSDYGMLYIRAIAILNAHPWVGGGHDAFRTLCSDPTYFKGLDWLGVTDAMVATRPDACNIHPHQFYLEAASAGGYPGLALFAAMTATAVWTLWRAQRIPGQDATQRLWRTAFLVQIAVAFWPIAATMDFLSVPSAGWIYLMLGWGLAHSRQS